MTPAAVTPAFPDGELKGTGPFCATDRLKAGFVSSTCASLIADETCKPRQNHDRYLLTGHWIASEVAIKSSAF